MQDTSNIYWNGVDSSYRLAKQPSGFVEGAVMLCGALFLALLIIAGACLFDVGDWRR